MAQKKEKYLIAKLLYFLYPNKRHINTLFKPNFFQDE